MKILKYQNLGVEAGLLSIRIIFTLLSQLMNAMIAASVQ